jgi:ribonucleoside-diphosphate reductase alpha subunit
MFVINRKGQKESMRYDNITDRNVELSRDLDIDVAYLSKLVIQGLKNGIKTSEIDELSSETAANMSTYNPQYDTLASRIVVSNLHKNTKVSFIETMRDLFNYKSEDGRNFGIISKTMMDFMEEHKEVIENSIDYKRDFNFSYFGFKTLEKSYLNKINNKVVERPQHMLMRVAIGIHGPINEYKGDIDKAIETYNEISQGKFTHASPTLFNACAERSQLSSCFLLHMEDDLEHIYETNKRSALISKYAGGIGIDISKVRAKGSKIHSTNGRSDGIVPMVQVFNSTARYCNQCFVPNTDIYLKNTIKHICDVKEGDYVITKDGSYKRVNEVFVSDRDEEILRITNTHTMEPLECTKQHELFVLKRGHYTPEFIAASEVEIGDFMVYISNTDNEVTNTNVEQYYSYGKLIRNNNESNFKLDNISLFDTKTKIIRFITGLITNVNDKGDFQIAHPSYEFKKQVRYLLVKINVLPKYHNNILEIPSNWLNFKNSNYTYSEITHIQKFNYKGKVYDLNIEQNHNYMTSNGLVHNSGRRKGSIAMYIQPWHPDIFDFLALRYNNPPEELRARDIFLALWIPDIFMKRVETDDVWSLFCPSVVPKLADTYGEEFEKIYSEAEEQKLYFKQVKAREVWEAVLRSQEETGLPYMLYKDHINNKSNQKNIGIIRSSNLCTEVVQYTDRNSVAVCNLASIALPKYVYYDKDNKPTFNFKELGRITEMITENLNLIIDKNFYPIKEAETNNLNYRPIGIGIQGLADVFAMFKYAWEDPEAKKLNRLIFEVIYYHAVKKSNELALKFGSYSAFEGSPISQGILQNDLWQQTPLSNNTQEEVYLDWDKLKNDVKLGMRNSLLVAPMPTASTAQILGNNEAFEPFTSNIYSRSVLAGDFVVINKHLYRDLKELDLWDKELVNKIIRNNGSVQSIEDIPERIRKIYKTVWEVPQRILIDMAADRGAFIDQSQSLNIFIDRPTHSKLTSMHFYGWKKGLKTGSYYIRSKPAVEAVKFTIKPSDKTEKKTVVCTDEICTVCSS